MKKRIWLFGLLGVVILAAGCATSFQGVCRHESLYAAAVVGESYLVRIAVGKSDMGTHAQAQAKINGQWEWLKVSWPNVAISTQDKFSPNEYIYGENIAAALFIIIRKGAGK
jgi:hypothetical protein